MRIVVDPGHGMGNRKFGVFDPGIVGVNASREADWNLRYAGSMATALRERNQKCFLTRKDNLSNCHLRDRVNTANALKADLLLSIHFNGDAIPGVDVADKKVKGFEAIYGTARSAPIAHAITGAVSYFHPTRVVTARSNLYVLRFNPSVLIEVGFLDDPDDYAIITRADWMRQFCKDVAFAIVGVLDTKEENQ